MPDPTPRLAAASSAVATSATPAAQASTQLVSNAQPATTAASAPAAASADRQQIATMARDLAALRQTIDRLAAGQEKLTRELAKLEADKPQADKPQADKTQADKPAAEKPAKRVQRRVSESGGSADVFDPAQNPNAPGVPRALGSIVVPRGAPR
jgi:septal ring factor EnvC (AmiA/AmiB activator)